MNESRQPSAPASALDSIRSRLNNLEEQTDSPGWRRLKNVVLVLGALGALVALPRGIVDGWRVLAGEDLRGEYSRQLSLFPVIPSDDSSRTIAFGIKFTVINDGERLVLLQEARGTLAGGDTNVPFTSSQFSCRTSGQEFELPLAVGGKDSVRIACTVTTSWGQRVARVLDGAFRQS
jgi:hypothetical protein